MQNGQSTELPRHLRISKPSPWVTRFAHLVAEGASVLDLAAGGGRHGRLFLARGCAVTFVDKDVQALTDLEGNKAAEVIEADLEEGAPWPLEGRTFDAVIVTNYLYRPLLDRIIGAVAPGGVLIYETFARGNEDFTRPRNPDHLLKSGELLEAVQGKLQVVAYEHGRIETAELPGVKSRIVAVKNLGVSEREDGEPEAAPL